MVGLPGSGKSTLANEIFVLGHECPTIHSSDKLRKELYGDENNQLNNGDLFVKLHRRIKCDLANGKDVVYDATGISKKRRVAFLNELKNIKCEKHCVAVMTPYQQCLEWNTQRERIVPEEVIKRMYMNWCPPHSHEGFDKIWIKFNVQSKFDVRLVNWLKDSANFNQENSHHKLTLLGHCLRAAEIVSQNIPYNRRLVIAAFIHDNGKIFTKTRLNSKGVEDGECHYYQHQNVGAYDSMFYLDQMREFTDDDILYIANLIYYHMHPYMAWSQSDRARRKAEKLIGSEMMGDIDELHKADLTAH